MLSQVLEDEVCQILIDLTEEIAHLAVNERADLVIEQLLAEGLARITLTQEYCHGTHLADCRPLDVSGPQSPPVLRYLALDLEQLGVPLCDLLRVCEAITSVLELDQRPLFLVRLVLFVLITFESDLGFRLDGFRLLYLLRHNVNRRGSDVEPDRRGIFCQQTSLLLFLLELSHFLHLSFEELFRFSLERFDLFFLLMPISQVVLELSLSN